ncbi:MAG: methylmalonyl Co-A mutase-associated GTPase MeaB [Ignavibacteria bacterium]|nr:methylmalonyl Co-A mutase-associated GTPase MeaB [Ignavibacteria bacterium]
MSSAEKLLADLRAGSRRALSKCLSVLESTTAQDRELAYELLALCKPHGNTWRIGVTGPPGVGKSSFLEEFGQILLRQGRTVAVLAVDPSSTKTGGSILGDKVRMPQLSLEDRAFVRPSPSRACLGGITPTTRDAIILCEEASYDTILIETVGVGQSEIEVASMVDMFLLLALPTAGDEVQGIKRGIMEMAHAILVTKSDLDEGASNRAQAILRSAMQFMLPPTEQWSVRIQAVSVIKQYGLEETAKLVRSFFDESRSKLRESIRSEQRQQWFDMALHHELFDMLVSQARATTLLADLRSKAIIGTLPPTVAVHRLLSHLQLSITEQT